MSEYPLVFTVRDAIAGNGFLAGVTLSGRGLMVKERDDIWWMYGVRPAAIAARGETPAGAYLDFRTTLFATLVDAATEAVCFEGFKAEVERFFYERDQSEEQRWQAAGDAIRRGEVVPEAPYFTGLKREAPDARPVTISVERLDTQHVFTASDNVLETYALIPAA